MARGVVKRQSPVGGTGPWGADTPQDEGEARARLLAAAEACYATRGVARTTIVDIAREAGVHRSTVYVYFKNKDEVLAACFVQAVRSLFDAAEPCFHTGEPFLEQLVRATIVGLGTARDSATVMLLVGDGDLGRTYRAAEASESWRQKLTEVLGQRIAAAVTAGEVRDDVAVETMSRWVTRLAFSLVQEPCSPADGGDEALLRAFYFGTLSARN